MVALAQKRGRVNRSGAKYVLIEHRRRPRVQKFILGRAMDQVDPPRSEPFAKWASRRVWQVASITLMVLSVVLFVAVLVSNLQRPKVSVSAVGRHDCRFLHFQSSFG